MNQDLIAAIVITLFYMVACVAAYYLGRIHGYLEGKEKP